MTPKTHEEIVARPDLSKGGVTDTNEVAMPEAGESSTREAGAEVEKHRRLKKKYQTRMGKHILAP